MASGKKPSSAHSSAAPSASRGRSGARIAASRACASAGSSTSSRTGTTPVACQPDARRLVIRYRPALARASSGATSAGSVTLSRITSHPGVGGQPLHRPFPQRLQRQHPGQRRLQRDRQARQPGVDISRGGGGDPPGQGVIGGVRGGPPRGQRALADPAQAVHRLHHHPARPGHGRIQPGQLARPAHEQPRPRQVRQARRGGQLRPRPERLLRQRRLELTWVPIWVNVLESRDSPRISTRAPPPGSPGGAAVMAGGS